MTPESSSPSHVDLHHPPLATSTNHRKISCNHVYSTSNSCTRSRTSSTRETIKLSYHITMNIGWHQCQHNHLNVNTNRRNHTTRITSIQRLIYIGLTSMPTWASFHHEPMATISPFGINGNHTQTSNQPPLSLLLSNQWKRVNSIWWGNKNTSTNNEASDLCIAKK